MIPTGSTSFLSAGGRTRKISGAEGVSIKKEGMDTSSESESEKERHG